MKAGSRRPLSSAPLVSSLRDCPAVVLWPWVSPVLKRACIETLPFGEAAPNYSSPRSSLPPWGETTAFLRWEPTLARHRSLGPACSLVRYPTLIVAIRSRTMACRVVVARWAIGKSGAREIWKVRLLPCVIRRIGQRGVSGVMQPRMPFGRHRRRIRVSGYTTHRRTRRRPRPG